MTLTDSPYKKEISAELAPNMFVVSTGIEYIKTWMVLRVDRLLLKLILY